MICKNPYVKGDAAYGCGQCLPCRLNRRRLWTHRIMLETMKHGDNAYVTLSYENLPPNGSLQPKDVQDWLKRLRREIEPQKIRYYLVGEYGDQTQRPHYHAAIFGLASCKRGETLKLARVCCPQCELIKRTWGHGHVYLGSLTSHSASYIAGYVTKKMTKKDDPRLKGRYPEFARMSLRPGIGATAVEDLVNFLHTSIGADVLEKNGDVPSVLRKDGKLNPLGRYIRRKIREAYGFKDPGTPKELLQKLSQEMQEMLKDTLPEKTSFSSREEVRFNTKQALINKNLGKIRSIEARGKIYNKKGSL